MLIVAMLTGTGILAIAIHPQLAVGGIQKLMYQKNPVNTYSPLHEPSEGMTESGLYKITDREYGTEYPNSFLDITYPSGNVKEKHPTLFYFHNRQCRLCAGAGLPFSGSAHSGKSGICMGKGACR